MEAPLVLDRYRRPLLASAVELKRRIGNIQTGEFLSHLDSGGRRSEIALSSTLHRIASYLGWREELARQLTHLQYANDDQTKEVMRLLENVSTTWSSSGIDNVDGTPRLMLWKDEQRAIGGLMRGSDGATAVLGF